MPWRPTDNPPRTHALSEASVSSGKSGWAIDCPAGSHQTGGDQKHDNVSLLARLANVPASALSDYLARADRRTGERFIFQHACLVRLRFAERADLARYSLALGCFHLSPS
jgi:hypothetical protein